MSKRDATPAPPDVVPKDIDRLDGVAHPRTASRLLGHGSAAAALGGAIASGRPHHAWLIAGPRGVGKATLAYLATKRLLDQPPEGAAGLFGEPTPTPAERTGLDPSPDSRAHRLIAHGAHPGLVELRRALNEKTNRPRQAIAVDDVRKAIEFFQLSAADGGWRAAIVDPADDLNVAAANALLKMLEEPPPRAMFLLIAHAPGGLPATIRSRCRLLTLRALAPEDTRAALAAAAPDLSGDMLEQALALAPGSPGAAAELCVDEGLALYGRWLRLLADGPPFDRRKLADLLETHMGRGAAEKAAISGRMLRLALERLALTGARGAAPAGAPPGEAKALARLSPNPATAQVWAAASLDVAERLADAARLNLDPARTIFDTALYVEEVAPR